MITYDLTKPLYKYLQYDHAVSMVEKGYLRIGTLFDFRNQEKYGAAVGDNDEGVRSVSVPSNATGNVDIDYLKLSNGATLSNVSIINMGPSNIAVESREHSPNYYIYCASQEKDFKIMKEFGCDICVEIFDPKLFFEEITKSLKEQKYCSGTPIVSPCVYKPNREEIPGTNIRHVVQHTTPVWLQKNPEYLYQAEVRALWTPIDQNIEPKFITCEGIKDACRIIELK